MSKVLSYEQMNKDVDCLYKKFPDFFARNETHSFDAIFRSTYKKGTESTKNSATINCDSCGRACWDGESCIYVFWYTGEKIEPEDLICEECYLVFRSKK